MKAGIVAARVQTPLEQVQYMVRDCTVKGIGGVLCRIHGLLIGGWFFDYLLD